ncbi:hypothetical protein BpHYR1_017443 [Brachionus plicatilis]|uniref:Uncharacterized protein n=1 Tax=Brachionus plicatilis TaxID=10195 RepID=A0A3M7R2Z7_BRAPC|nr:hypothetical protein BpHYR1_017443 [Brachionus plicatilis]
MSGYLRIIRKTIIFSWIIVLKKKSFCAERFDIVLNGRPNGLIQLCMPFIISIKSILAKKFLNA